MILYILALFSLILVIPILFLLPMGLSNRGKMIILGFGFIISLLGIMSRSLFPIWQSALIMLLFIIVTTYLMMKKGTNLLFSKQEEEDMEAPFTSLYEDSVMVEQKTVSVSKLEEGEIEITELEPQVNSLTESERKEELELESFDLDVDLELLEQTSPIQEDELLLKEKEEIEDSHYLEPEKEIEDVDISYMAEIEKLLEQESFSGEVEKNELKEQTPPLPIFDDLEVAVSSEKDNQPEDKHLNEELYLDVDELEELPMLDLKEEIPDIEIEEEAIAEAENLSDIEMLDELAGFTIEEEEENSLESIEDTLIELPKEELSILAHKIINNTLSQLDVMKDTLDKQEFEMLLLQCMKESIPLNEYFAFSTMLVDLYRNNNDMEKLQSLLLALKDKYCQQPLVLEQIIFMEEKYLN